MKRDLRCWMKQIPDETDLFALNIPGTHDCVTQFVQFSHFSRCQNKNISEQLQLGIRALDVRVCAQGNRLKMIHGIAKVFNSSNHLSPQMDLEDVLNHCYRFLDENPSESILFQFKNDNDKNDGKCRNNEIFFYNLFHTYLKSSPQKWYLKNKIPSMGEARGKIILIRRCRMDAKPEFTDSNTGIDFSRWVEQDAKEPQPLSLSTGGKSSADFLIQDRFKYKPKPRWEKVIRPFLEERQPFHGQYIICYLSTAGGLAGPYRNARFINAKFMEYSLKKNSYYGTVYTDFPTPKLTERIIALNDLYL